jgi:hypothetical protein
MRLNIEKRVKLAAILVFLGLVCMLLSFTRLHPLAFIGFLGIACPLTIAGMILFLLTLLQKDSVETPKGGRTAGGD